MAQFLPIFNHIAAVKRIAVSCQFLVKWHAILLFWSITIYLTMCYCCYIVSIATMITAKHTIFFIND